MFQSISHRVFKCLLEEEFKVEEHKRLEGISCAITWEEENALRYVSGYVCRKVQQKIGASNLKTREEMIQFCVELSGDEDSDRGTEEWTNTIDRGGLWHVNDNTYIVFCVLEVEIRKHLNISAAKDLDNGTQETILKAVLKNEDLLFQWALVTSNSDDEVGQKVLELICELYLTVGGFAFAKSCLELYKQTHKKSIQKSKALRKSIASKTDSDMD